ncbi:peptidylprolyl isomerase [Rhodobacterales bacterium HKCCE2091]|nr:peptidylprolyl isomerase [Rhodobacterales bacterium HKCCE2091]
MRRAFAALICLTLPTAPAWAQDSAFSAAVTVNDRAVTYYEISQRERFLQLLNAPPEVIAQVPDTLVDERLQVEEAERMEVLPSEEDLIGGMNEFAGRANLSAEELIGQLEGVGVAGQTFRDFVYAGLAWRNVVRARFGPQVQITEQEIERALIQAEGETGDRVLLSEIVLPAPPDSRNRVQEIAQEMSDDLQGDPEAFAEAARLHSVAQTARNGGELAWRALDTLPPALVPILRAMEPGDVTRPLPIGPETIGLFQLREYAASERVGPGANAVEYAVAAISGGAAEAQALANSVDTCDDLYAALPGGFTIETRAPGQVPGNIAAELANLDAGEASWNQATPEGALMFVMLCSRTAEIPEGYREEIRQQLVNQRLAGYAESYLAELRAEAFISEGG